MQLCRRTAKKARLFQDLATHFRRITETTLFIPSRIVRRFSSPSIQLVRHSLRHILRAQPSIPELFPLSQIDPLHTIRREVIELRRRRTESPDTAVHLWYESFVCVCESPPTDAGHE
jgi:hypothetical protein